MNSTELVDSFSEFKELKNIDKQTMQHVLEDVFRAMFKKKFNTDEHIDIIVNIDKGDVQIFLNKEIVDDGEVEAIIRSNVRELGKEQGTSRELVNARSRGTDNRRSRNDSDRTSSQRRAD